MITLKNVTKKYDGTVVLQNFNYSFADTGITCLLGASGSGKTTLLNLLAGFDRDYSGEIAVFDQKISAMNANQLCSYRKNTTGFIFQDYNLIAGYDVLENILLAAELNGKSQAENEGAAKALLEKLGLSDKLHAKAENLSGGQKQRIAIARALINDPPILFADEPTGALDRKTTDQIMELLKEISKTRLVFLVTHDTKLCGYADEVISIVDGGIKVKKQRADATETAHASVHSVAEKVPIAKRSVRNFKNHLSRYVAVALAIAIGVTGFLFSLSSQNIMNLSIGDFQEKNTALQSGYIGTDTLSNSEVETITEKLGSNNHIESFYRQYILHGCALSFGGNSVNIPEKTPNSRANEIMTMGVMPRSGQDKIAFSPSAAKQLADDIQTLVGKKIAFRCGTKEYTLTVSGICGGSFDVFYLSPDVELALYETMKNEPVYSVTYEVLSFAEVPLTEMMLKADGIAVQSAANQVSALLDNFKDMQTLFFVLSLFILAVALFICTLLILKLTNARFREMGLLSALGYSKGEIKQLLLTENALLLGLALLSNLAVLAAGTTVLKLGFAVAVTVSPMQIAASLLGTAVILTIICGAASARLTRVGPAVALKA